MTTCPVKGCGRVSVNDGDCPEHGPMTPAAEKAANKATKRAAPKLAHRDDPLVLRTVELGDIALREDPESDGRTISGYAYRWGEYTEPGATLEFGGAAEGFARGAFAAAIAERQGRPWPFLARHRGTTVGAVTFTEDDIGLRYDGRLLDTQSARDFAEEVRAGVAAASLEFVYTGTNPLRQAGRVIHRTVRRIAGIAGVYAPAYRGATVALREGVEPMNTCGTCGAELALGVAHACPTAIVPAPVAERAGTVQMTPEAQTALIRDVATEIYRQYAERESGIIVRPDPLYGHGSLARAFGAYADGEIADRAWLVRALATRALDDTVTTAGANAGLLEGALTVSRVQRIVTLGRPTITAFGGPRPIGDGTGMNLTWPYFDGTLTDFVAAQSAEKAEITSASMDIKLGSEALVTYAGGTDMSYQLIRRGSPSAIDAWLQIVMAAWAYVTNLAFVTELESGSVTLDFAEAATAVDYAELVGHLVDASVTVQAATGQPAAFAIMGTTLFKVAAKATLAASNAIASTPQASISALDLNVGGIRLIHDAAVTAGKAIISNELAAGWHEEGPFQAAAEDVAKLGRDVAIWSMGAGARYIPAGIIEAYDVTP